MKEQTTHGRTDHGLPVCLTPLDWEGDFGLARIYDRLSPWS